MHAPIDAIKEEVKRQFKNTPDYVNSVYYGFKRVDGVETDTLCIVFGVDQKKPINTIPPSEVLPRAIMIAGVSVPTDVIESSPAVLLGACYNHWDEGNIEIQRLRGTPEALVPMRGGQEITMFPDGWGIYGGQSVGTLGFFAVDNFDNRIVGVTNTHVVVDPLFYTGDPARVLTNEIFSPSNIVEPKFWVVDGLKYPTGCLINGTVCDSVRGCSQQYHHAGLYVKRYIPYDTDGDNEVDAALLIMNNDKLQNSNQYFVDENSYKVWGPTDVPEYTNHLPFATTAELDNFLTATPAARVYSTGRTTGPKGYCDNTITHLKISSTAASIMFNENGYTTDFTDLIKFEQTSSNTSLWSGPARSLAAVRGGDSGSALLADINGVRKIIGIVFAGPTSTNADYGKIGYACRIDKVAAALNIRAWDSTYQFSRSTSLSVPSPRLVTEPIADSGLQSSVIRDGFKYWHAGTTNRRDIVQYPPTDITTVPSPIGVNETAIGGDLACLFSTTDADEVDFFTYALVEGAGDADNNAFYIDPGTNQLRVWLPQNVGNTPVDQFYASVALLVHANGTAGSTVFTDSSRNSRQVTGQNITVTDAHLRAGFGTGVGDVPGGSSLLSIPGNINLNGDFTIEMWVRPTGSAQEPQLLTDRNSGLTLYLTAPAKNMYLYMPGVAPITASSGLSDVPANTWSHIALSRSGQNVYLFLNGALYSTGTLATPIIFGADFFGGNFIGQFDEVRITRRARYTTPFSLPTAAFPDGAAPFDAATKSSYAIRVRSTDTRGFYIEKPFTVTIVPQAKFAPTDIALSNNTIEENNSVGATLGTFSTTDQDPGDTFTYSLVPGSGDTGNASFTIVGNTLKAASAFVFSQQSAYTIRVQSLDAAGFVFQKNFNITVTRVPSAPVFEFISETPDEFGGNSTIALYGGANALLGTFDITDKDPASAESDIVFSLPTAGAGSTHNNLFQLSGNQLRSKINLTYNNPAFTDVGGYVAIYLRVIATDTRTNKFSAQQFVLYVYPPALPAYSFNQEAGSFLLTNNALVGAFTLTGGRSGIVAADMAYTLVSGTSGSDEHNQYFSISGDQLRTVGALTGAEATSNVYYIRVRGTDTLTGEFYEISLTLTVVPFVAPTFSFTPEDEADFMYQPAGVLVGTFAITSKDPATLENQITFSRVVAGSNTAGAKHNLLFEIDGDQLLAEDTLRHGNADAAYFYGSPRTFYVTIRATDTRTGLYTETPITIDISFVITPALTFTEEAQSVFMYQPAPALLGTLSTTTIDANSTAADITYTLTPTAFGLTAVPDAVQGDGELLSDYNIITTAAANSGVTLPIATTNKTVVIINSGANDINIFPAVAALIDEGTVNQPYVLAAGAAAQFYAIQTTEWSVDFADARAAMHNALFSITADEIYTVNTLSAVAGNEYGGVRYFYLTVRVTDTRTLLYSESALSVDVNDLADLTFSLSDNYISPDVNNEVVAGDFLSTITLNPNHVYGETVYSFVSGTGSESNNLFSITGTTLSNNAALTTSNAISDSGDPPTYTYNLRIKATNAATEQETTTTFTLPAYFS